MTFRTTIAFTVLSVLATGVAHAKKDEHHHGHDPLPPGLEKRQQQGKPLPPGWQKKLSRGDVLDKDIYARGEIVVPVGKDGTLTIEVEGTLLKLNEKTREIVSIMYR